MPPDLPAESLPSLHLLPQPPPFPPGRPAAVLVSLWPLTEGLSVLFIARARTGSVHDGQIAFPGGALEPQDQGQATRAALREAQEEVGLSPTTLQVMGFLPAVAIPVSGYAVMPVVAWCRGAPEVLQPHAGEVERTFFVPLQELRAVRTWERRTRGGRTGLWPVFPTSQGRIWGATAIILHALLRRSPPGMPPTPPPAPRAAATTR